MSLDKLADFRFGRKVKLHGLNAAADLNGQIGRLRDFYADRGRWAVALPGSAAPKLLKPDNLEMLPADPLDFANVFVDVLADDMVLRMFSFLPGRALLDVGCACSVLNNHSQHNVVLWRSLCKALLGEALTTLHEEVWGAASNAHRFNSSLFWRALFRTAYEGKRFEYATDFRQRFPKFYPNLTDEFRSHSLGDGLAIEADKDFTQALSASGHTVNAIGNLMVMIGGWRPRLDGDMLYVCILDLSRGRIFEPKLSAGSALPCRRLRHASCVVNLGRQTSHLNTADPMIIQSQAVLVLGGCNDKTHEPCGGLNVLSLLEFTGEDGSQVCWRELYADGECPRAIWHHTAGSFSQGKRVVVFGGDIPTSDPEFVRIGDRMHTAHVYLLDVEMRVWHRVQTSGDVPSWRSLHASASYTSLSDGSERFIIMGGCEKHLPIFGGGVPASMEGYSLNLQTLKWQSGKSAARRRRTSGSRFLPSARMRFAAERYGRHLLVYGGHGSQDIADESELIALNLMTLEWSQVEITNAPVNFEHAPAAVLCGGCLMGGVMMTSSGVVPVPKLDFVCVCRPGEILD